MIVELYAKSDVGRVRRGNEDNFLVLDLSTEQTWTGSDGAIPPEKLTRFDLGNKGLVLVVSDGMKRRRHLGEKCDFLRHTILGNTELLLRKVRNVHTGTVSSDNGHGNQVRICF